MRRFTCLEIGQAKITDRTLESCKNLHSTTNALTGAYVALL